ncbi:hypothetical protein ASPCADRAFT_508480 [Aspergillus carbonarius ITEM 5010]|uniref:MARVEL domain-containing protein n=1 Tax=Aspergillus carbonarius (strain ITEM 5010) TaxID=602072 RepID=A0A1R3RFP7_ASPC5|nr:hypothetical protein ASPCADRAFT_508480 [Aspergillus carbonarius ITEM 5010]
MPLPPRPTTTTTLRTTQLLLSTITAILYGIDLAHASNSQTHAQASWIYAEFVAAVSALTSTVHLFLPGIHAAWATLDGVILVLWVALVGVFATLYLPVRVGVADVSFTDSVSRMKVAVCVDIISMVVWVGTVGLGVMKCVRGERRRDRLDGEGRDVQGGGEGECVDEEGKIGGEGGKRLSLASTIWDGRGEGRDDEKGEDEGLKVKSDEDYNI